jgi:hypothetical protein
MCSWPSSTFTTSSGLILGASAGQVLEPGQQHAREGGAQQVRRGLEAAGQARLAHGSLIGVLARGCAAGVDEQGRVLGGRPLRRARASQAKRWPLT